MDIQQQLAELRRRVASIDRKYARKEAPKPAAPAPLFDPRPARYFVEELMSGQVVATAAGEHFETEKLYERHRRHGSMDISTLVELPEDLLSALSEGEIAKSHPTRWAFLDTETTGLAGGAGTYAFLIGVGSIDEHGFRVRQFFMRDFGDEPSLLAGLTEHLARFDVLITYNGRTYDQPLLETRFRMARTRPPFARMAHLDLLYGARRLWKLRLESCRLVDLENQILGLEREGDLPGEMIPYYYFEYLRTRQAFRLVPIFHHNVMDIVSLACLTAIVPFAFQSPENTQVRHGADLVGLGRWLSRAEQPERAVALLRRAVDIGLPDHLLFQTLWEVAMLEKRLERLDAALAILRELSESRNPYRTRALEELAKHYEHREKDLGMALDMTRAALSLEDTVGIRRREQRLERRLKRGPRRLKRPAG
ncbi:MAG: ribonuclease H-like domain-containing protein [Bryobacteraceae bacterium]